MRKTIISWRQTGRPTKDLMLFEEVEDDIPDYHYSNNGPDTGCLVLIIIGLALYIIIEHLSR